jgi:hypothetical protein
MGTALPMPARPASHPAENARIPTTTPTSPARNVRRVTVTSLPHQITRSIGRSSDPRIDHEITTSPVQPIQVR